ncbi:hypothetical protein DL546_008504 [Coniochaeta pulveracea]|uniref:Uncharacterized protein n=1 Tax=Coniochaeta pulveracea TaxID=177199 RepID=A0A420YJY5_9PEZI|nr:hypothetical protein DL546_008504 [Coniochaeta pulveracea]
MAPPLLPDFPLLVSTDDLNHPPPLPSPRYPRDPLTSTTISPPENPRVRASHLRHRRKLAHLYDTLHRPVHLAQLAEDAAAKEAGQFSELHDRRLKEDKRAKHTHLEARHLDPYTFFNTPRILPANIFHRPTDPPCTVALTGIPPSVPSYNSVCMAHRLAWNPKAGKPAPVLADHVSNGMSVRSKWDYASRGEDEPDLCDVLLNNGMALPDWKKAYAEEAAAQQELNEEFIQECQTMYNLDRALMRHQTVTERSDQGGQAEAPNQHAYFALLHNLHDQSHPLRPRLPRNRLVLSPKDAAFLRYHYWMLILDPEYQPPRKPLELILRRVQLYRTTEPTKEDVMGLLQLALDAREEVKREVRSHGEGCSWQEAGVWTGPYRAPWILTARARGLAFLVVFLVLEIWLWSELLAGLGMHVCLAERWEHFREGLNRSHISVLQDEEGCEEDCIRLPRGKSLHDELSDCEALPNND